MQSIGVSGNTEIPKVPQQLPPECCPLLANRFMPMLPTPIRDAPRFDPNFSRLGEVMVRDLSLYEAVSQSEGGDAQ